MSDNLFNKSILILWVTYFILFINKTYNKNLLQNTFICVEEKKNRKIEIYEF